jgi:hypothetical protein
VGSTRLSFLVAALALPAAAASGQAAPAADVKAVVATLPPDALLTADDPGKVAALMRQLGYRAELTTDQTGDPRIITGFAGMQASLWFNDCDDKGQGCRSIRMQVGLLTDRKLSLEQVNAFNNSWRFGTLSLDEDRDPLLNHDLWLVKPGVPVAVLAENIRQFDALVRELRALVAAREAAPDS